MSKFDNHPTVRQDREQSAINDSTIASPLDADWLRSLCLKLGVDDVGFVEIDRPEIAAQRQDILVAFPPTKTLVPQGGSQKSKVKSIMDRTYAKIAEKLNLSNRQDAKNAKNS